MNEKYIPLFEGISNDIELTTKNLIEMGYKKPSRLKEKGILRRESRGHYALDNIQEFFNYGLGLKDTNPEQYLKVMLKCLELDPNFGSALFQMFVYGLRKKDYESSFNYLTKLINLNNVSYQNDYNLYLLLLSRIIELPEEYKEKAANLSLIDILVPKTDKRFNDRYTENQIREAFFNSDYQKAAILSNKRNNDGFTKIVYFQMLKFFLKKLNKSKQANKQKPISYLEAIRNHQYLEIQEHLNTLDDSSYKNSVLKQLVNSYLEISSTCTIPEIKPYTGKGLKDMLNANDFPRAFALVQTNPNNEKTPMYHILKDINDLINQLKDEENKVYTLNDVLNALVNNDNYLFVLRKYLAEIKKPEYESLFLALIKLCLFGGEIGFNSVLYHLYNLSLNKLSVNFRAYHQYFNEAIQNKCFDEARIYLEIIKAGKNLGLNNIDISSLEYALDKFEIQHKRDQAIATITTSINEVINTQGVVLLDKKDVPESMLNAYLKDCDNIIVTSLKDKIILRYFKFKHVNIRAFNTNADLSYKHGNYVDCIASCMTLLNSLETTRNFVYQLLGLSHFHLGSLEEAKKYLTIATLSGEYDNKSLISQIDEKLRASKEENLKRELKRQEQETE